MLFTQPFCHCAKQCVQLAFLFYFTVRASKPPVHVPRTVFCVLSMLSKSRPRGIPSATFHFWLNSLEALFVYSIVSVWGCGRALCVCVCPLYIGQLNDLDLGAPSIAFNTTPLNYLCQVLLLTSSINSSSVHFETSTHAQTIQIKSYSYVKRVGII